MTKKSHIAIALKNAFNAVTSWLNKASQVSKPNTHFKIAKYRSPEQLAKIAGRLGKPLHKKYEGRFPKHTKTKPFWW